MPKQNISCAVYFEKPKLYNVILANKWLLIDSEMLIRDHVVILADPGGGAFLGIGLEPLDLEFVLR